MICFPCSFCKELLDADDQGAGGKMPCPHCRCLTPIPNQAVRATASPSDNRPAAAAPPAPDVTGDMPRAQLDWLRDHLELNIPPGFAALGPIEVAAFTQRPERLAAIIPTVFFGGMVLLMTIIGSLTTASQNVWLALGILAGGVAAVALLGLLFWGMSCGFRRFACVACPRGFLWRRGRILRQYRWDQIRAPYLDYTVFTQKVKGQPVQRTWYTVRFLEMDDGTMLFFPEEFPGRQEVFAAIAKHMYLLHYPRAEQAVRAGRHVPFGDHLELSRDALILRGELIPWQRVSHLSVFDESVYLHLLDDPQNRDLSSPKMVPNAEVLVDLGNALARAAHDQHF
jgi:hypothetical protein